MATKKLEAFKIGDKHKPRVSSAASLKDKHMEAASVGFARIEGLLDNEKPSEVGEQLNSLLDRLLELEGQSTTPKAKSSCKKARAAVERTVDLLDYLFRTKEALAVAATRQK